jgi:4,5-dihydroxyphthalate decarboxylase
MAEITLAAATLTRPWTAAVKDGSVPVGPVSAGSAGRFRLEFEEVPVIIRAFRRMVRSLDFDVTEMAFTTYLCAKSFGKPFTALPVFLVRGFHHGAITHSAAAGLVEPRALEGRRVGVNRGYTVTTGVWARGILADQYGVDLDRVTWVPSGDEHVAEYRPPANVVPAGPGQDVPAQVASGSLAAGVGFPAGGAGGAGVAPLLPDAEQAGYDALRDRGLYPINHLLVVKDELLARYPELAPALFAAYAEAKNQYVARLRAGAITDPDPAGRMLQRVMEITGADPLPYGIAPNRAMIDQLVRHAVSQHILDKPFTAEELFPASTHDLTA